MRPPLHSAIVREERTMEWFHISGLKYSEIDSFSVSEEKTDADTKIGPTNSMK